MTNPNIKTEVKHSESKDAWNVIGKCFGRKYKIARVPYVKITGSWILTEKERFEALQHAEFISYCFNNSEKILSEK